MAPENSRPRLPRIYTGLDLTKFFICVFSPLPLRHWSFPSHLKGPLSCQEVLHLPHYLVHPTSVSTSCATHRSFCLLPRSQQGFSPPISQRKPKPAWWYFVNSQPSTFWPNVSVRPCCTPAPLTHIPVLSEGRASACTLGPIIHAKLIILKLLFTHSLFLSLPHSFHPHRLNSIFPLNHGNIFGSLLP